MFLCLCVFVCVFVAGNPVLSIDVDIPLPTIRDLRAGSVVRPRIVVHQNLPQFLDAHSVEHPPRFGEDRLWGVWGALIHNVTNQITHIQRVNIEAHPCACVCARACDGYDG